MVGGDRMAAVECFAHGVQRTGADVAEYHADRRDRQRQYARLLASVAVGAHCYFLFLSVPGSSRPAPACAGLEPPACRSSDKADDATRFRAVTRLRRWVFGYHRENMESVW